jgi:hypothetical protein
MLDGCGVGLCVDVGLVVGELDGVGVGDGLTVGEFWLSAYHDAATKMMTAIKAMTKYAILFIK